MNEQEISQLRAVGLLPQSEQTVAPSAHPTAAPTHVQHVLATADDALVTERGVVTTPKISKMWEIALVAILLIITAVAHGTNMLQYPYYENDEGTYMSQAWSVVTSGTLSPYTYWYDHAPAGWFFIAAFTKLVGGFFAFGTSIDTGRVFMWLLHVVSVFFVYSIAKQLTKGRVLAGLVAGLVFALSPLALYFGRRVLLDNMMVFWVLLSLWTLVRAKVTLRATVFAAAAFGVAVLTKETAVFFLPAFLYVVWAGVHKSHRVFGLSLWVTISGLVISLYPLYALIKSEFFPASWFGSGKHVSLLETLKFQAGRGSGLPFWNTQSEFYTNLVEWFHRDTALMVIGGSALLLGLVFAYARKEFRAPLLFAVCMLWFLMRGGIIINFYILPLIPFLALLIGLVVSLLAESFSKFLVSIDWAKGIAYTYAGAAVVACALFVVPMLAQSGAIYTTDETAPMKQALEWTKQNLDPTAVMVVDNAIFVDLRESRFAGDPAFSNAEWFWKVEKDPTVFAERIGGDWLHVDYVLLSHEMVRQISDYQITLTKDILPHTSLVTGWTGGGAFLDLDKYISTNGDWMRVYKVHSQEEFVGETLWRADVAQYVHSYGQVVPESGVTTASTQADMLLRAVLVDDQKTFAGLWAWTRDHMQHRQGDKLVSEGWQNGSAAVDYNAYLAPNQDIATALILAGRKWKQAEYTTAGTEIVADIWNKLAISANGQTLLASSTKQGVQESRLVNTSLLAPASYRLFAQVDKSRPWATLADQSYTLLPNTTATLTKELTVSKSGVITKVTSGAYAPAVVEKHVAQDAVWFETDTAQAWFTTSTGEVASLTTATVKDKQLAQELYAEAIATHFNRTEKAWATELGFTEKSALWQAFSLFAPDQRLISVLRNITPVVATK